MRRLRLSVGLLIIWLIFFFNVERISSPVNIQSYTYIFVVIAVAIALIFPQLQRLPYLSLLSGLVFLFLLLKTYMEKGNWYQNLLQGYALPLTVTQISAIILTGILARQITQGLHEFEEVIASITFGQIGKLPGPFLEKQGPMYREVKRARRYQRPLAVIALKLTEEAFQIALPKTVKEVQQAMMKEYILARVARILNLHIHDFDTIALRDNCFIAVLPEVSAEEASIITRQLAKTVQENMDIKLQIGTANFPTQAVTFESLVELAIKEAEQNVKAQSDVKQPKQQPITREI